MDDSGSAVSRAGTLTGTTLTGLGMTGGISFSKIAAVNIRLGAGANVLAIAGTITGPTTVFAGAGPDAINVQAISGPTTLDGGLGNLTVNVGSTQPTLGGVLDAITAPLVVNGGLGVNALNADDSGSTVNKSGTLTSSTITGLGMADGIAYANIAALTIALGAGGENFTIASTDTGSSSVQDGPGADVVTVQTTRGFTTVSGGAGNDTTNVDATGAPAVFNAGAGVAVINIFAVGDVTTINAQSAVTTINIQSISGPTTVNGDGRDVVNVGSKRLQGGGVLAYIRRRWSSTVRRAWTSSTWTRPAPALPRTAYSPPARLPAWPWRTGSPMTIWPPSSSTWGPAATISPSPAPPRGSTLINGGAGVNAFDIQAVSGDTNVQGNAGSDAFTVGSRQGDRPGGPRRSPASLMLRAVARGPIASPSRADVDFTLGNSSLQLSNGESIGLGADHAGIAHRRARRQHVRRVRLDRQRHVDRRRRARIRSCRPSMPTPCSPTRS